MSTIFETSLLKLRNKTLENIVNSAIIDSVESGAIHGANNITEIFCKCKYLFEI